MKKVLLALTTVMMMFSFNVKADPSAAGLTVAPWVLPVAVMIAATQVEYKACNDLPYKWVKAEGSNFLTKVTQCK